MKVEGSGMTEPVILTESIPTTSSPLVLANVKVNDSKLLSIG
jgi:hypothetical protein